MANPWVCLAERRKSSKSIVLQKSVRIGVADDIPGPAAFDDYVGGSSWSLFDRLCVVGQDQSLEAQQIVPIGRNIDPVYDFLRGILW